MGLDDESASSGTQVEELELLLIGDCIGLFPSIIVILVDVVV